MGDITRTKAKVGLVFPEDAVIMNVLLAEAAEAGQILYLSSAGTYGLADTDAVGKEQARGMALEGGSAGQAVSMLKEGVVYGFTLSAMAYDDLAYLSTTAGELATSGGSIAVPCGMVIPLADPSKTKVLYFNPRWSTDYS